jgi:hypothetical protein
VKKKLHPVQVTMLLADIQAHRMSMPESELWFAVGPMKPGRTHIVIISPLRLAKTRLTFGSTTIPPLPIPADQLHLTKARWDAIGKLVGMLIGNAAPPMVVPQTDYL